MDYQLKGNIYQALELTLAPRESFYAERKALVAMDLGIESELISVGGGVMGKLKTLFSGEAIFLLRYYNPTNRPLHLTLSGKLGSLRPFELRRGQTLTLQTGSFVATSGEVEFDLHLSFNKLFKGMNLAYQRLRGEGTVFFDTVDTLLERHLAPGEQLVIDEDHLVAMVDIQDAQIRAYSRQGIVKNILSGEGFVLTCITGPGTVYLTPYRKICLPKTE